MSKQLPDTETCSRPGCEEPTPWDMPAVVLDRVWCCSPACALDHLDGLERPPETVTLHDPQHHVDRDGLPDVSSAAVNISRTVRGLADAAEAVHQANGMVGGQFRAARAGTEGLDLGE